MIIRSQNKAFIINFERVDTVCLGGIEEKSVITFTDAQVVTLGTYSTEAKAIKVLDMIQNEFQSEIRKHRVFQTPQDSEV
jgi:hypothetical protein